MTGYGLKYQKGENDSLIFFLDRDTIKSEIAANNIDHLIKNQDFSKYDYKISEASNELESHPDTVVILFDRI